MISTSVTLFAYALLMEGIGMKYWVSYDPDLNLENINSPTSYTLFFFVTTIVIYGLGIMQYAFAYVLKNFRPLRTEDFVDICSMCNISILFFDDTLSGFYIHGRSPYGQAEISSRELRKAIEFETAGKAQIRGLVPEDPDL